MRRLLKLSFLSTIFVMAASGQILAGNSSNHTDFEELLTRLSNVGYYADSVKFIVEMPQLAEDIVYQVQLQQFPDSNKRLSPCAYLINWKMTERDEPPFGFSAYFNGNHYRYSGQRLQEYHWTWDSIPFMPNELGALNSEGIQKSAQFADILPAMLAEKLEKMNNDSDYVVSFVPDTVVDGKKSVAVNALMVVNGVVASEQQYIFDAATLLPVRLHFENSPGSISEQTVDVVYAANPDTKPVDAIIDEQFLVSLYPDIFANYRESNFRIENLPGSSLPSFSLPRLSGDRFSYRKGDTFPAPLILAMLDPDGGFNPQFISAIRQAVASLPFSADIIWAFNGTNPDRIEEQVGSIRGEVALLSAKGLVRDCGVSSLPVAVIVAKDGTVKDVILGYSDNLSSDVIQKMAFLMD